MNSQTSSSSKTNQKQDWSSTFQNAFNNLFSTTSPYAASLFGSGKELMRGAAPILQQWGSQAMEAMRTGGVGANIPIISRALDASTAASGQGMEQLRQNLARTGESGSFANEALMQANQQAGQQAAAIGPGMAANYIQQAPGVATGEAGLGLGAMGQAAGLVRSGTSSGTGSGTSSGSSTSSGTSSGQTSSSPGFWDLFMSGLQAGGSAAGAFAGA